MLISADVWSQNKLCILISLGKYKSEHIKNIIVMLTASTVSMLPYNTSVLLTSVMYNKQVSVDRVVKIWQ